jgi:hypothetical protein
MLAEGKSLEVGLPISGVLDGGYNIVLKDANEKVGEYMLACKRYYKGGIFFARVLFWPDPDGLFPYESGCSSIPQSPALKLID